MSDLHFVDPETGVVGPELNLVEALPGWAAGFNDKVARQRHVLLVPVRPGSAIVRPVFLQETHNN